MPVTTDRPRTAMDELVELLRLLDRELRNELKDAANERTQLHPLRMSGKGR